jgi:hypothetical protein
VPNEHRQVRSPAAVHLDGGPEPCPVCESAARLDHIDLRRGAKHLTCLACAHRWRIVVTDEADEVVGSGNGTRHRHVGRSTRTGLAERLPPTSSP